MNLIKHNIETELEKDLEKKMIFISGPRQVGKTTLAKKIIKKKSGRYLLYDDVDDRREILKKNYLQDKYVCLDEFHKYNRWKAYLKGIYDKYKDDLRLIVTGSARLDIFQKSGDSLFGRYYLYYLHPLSLAEINKKPINLPQDLTQPHEKLDGLDALIRYSGFPEPFLCASDREHRRWASQRLQLLIQEELRELTHIQLLGIAENLMILIPERIGSLFSYNSIAEDLQISIPTVQNWLNIFERLFFVYKIKPYTKNITRSLHKRPKFYLWDWSEIKSDGACFENVIANHLYKAISIWNMLGLTNANLHFIRDRAGNEVDFLVTNDNQPWFLVEAKLADDKINSNLSYFSRRLKIPGIQVLKKSGIYFKEGALCVISANRWLGHLA